VVQKTTRENNDAIATQERTMDDFGETTGTAGVTTLNTPTDGHIETPGDKDWYSVSLEAGKEYRIKVEGAETGNGTLIDPVLGSIYDAAGLLIPGTSDDDSGDGLNSELLFTPTTTATYYVEVAAFGETSGTYSVTVEEATTSTFDLSAASVAKSEGDSGLTAYEFTITRSGDTSAAASVAWGVAGFGANPATADDFELGALPGNVLNFAAGQTSQIITVNVAGDETVETDEQFSVTLSTPSAGTDIGTGTKLGLILDDDTPANTGDAELALGGGDTINYEGQIGTTSYTFTVTRSGNTSIAASASWAVQATDEGDTVDGTDFDGGILPSGMVSFNPGETSKDITILVSADVDPEPTEVFSVVLSNPAVDTVITSGSKLGTIVDDETDDHGQTTDDASAIGLGGSKTGNIENGLDEDWFGIELMMGNEYQFDLEGSSTNMGTLDDPVVALHDSTGTLIQGTVKHSDGEGLNARLVYTPTVDGTFYVSASSVTNFGGTYTVSAQLKVNSPPTGAVTIDGDAEEGETLTASDTLADADGIGTISYQWNANGTPVLGATGSTYELAQDDVGKTITVTASYQDDGGTDESVTSNPTTAVTNVNDDPTGEVTITGEAAVGEELTASNTLADEDGLGTISYKWFAGGVEIIGVTGDKYTPTESDKGFPIRVEASYTDDQGTDETVTSNLTNPVTNGDLIEGTSGPDDLSGGDGDDTILGLEGRDTLEGLAGNDELNGGDDIDHAVFQSELLDYFILNNVDQIEVSGPASEGSDELINVERLHFTDISLAFDLDGNAGDTAKLLGVLVGSVDPGFMGQGIDIFDNSGLSFEQVMGLGLDVLLTTERTNADVLNLIYTNLIGQAPSQAELNALTAEFLDSGAYTQVGLALLAADHPFNTENIGFDELVITGVQYTPV